MAGRAAGRRFRHSAAVLPISRAALISRASSRPPHPGPGAGTAHTQTRCPAPPSAPAAVPPAPVEPLPKHLAQHNPSLHTVAAAVAGGSRRPAPWLQGGVLAGPWAGCRPV